MLFAINFDATVTIGDVLQVLGVVIAILVAYTKLIHRMNLLEFKVDEMWDWFKARRR